MYIYKNELHAGSIDNRDIHLRWYVPFAFSTWTPEASFRFSPRLMLNWRNWLGCIRDWRFDCRQYRYVNHRCYCPVGYTIDGSIRICGFGLQWFCSYYVGELPCCCDKVIEKLRGEWEAESCDTNLES